MSSCIVVAKQKFRYDVLPLRLLRGDDSHGLSMVLVDTDPAVRTHTASGNLSVADGARSFACIGNLCHQPNAFINSRGDG